MFTFKNVGKEMCFWARFFLTVLTVLWILAVCLGAIVLYLFLNESGVGDMIPGGAIILPVVGGILTFLLGYLVIRFSTIKLYAQGKMVEHLASIDRKLDEMHAGQTAAVPVESPYAAPSVSAEAPVFIPAADVPVEETKSAPAVEVPAPKPAKKGFCMNCGAQNPEGSMFCTNCGSPLS